MIATHGIGSSYSLVASPELHRVAVARIDGGADAKLSQPSPRQASRSGSAGRVVASLRHLLPRLHPPFQQPPGDFRKRLPRSQILPNPAVQAGGDAEPSNVRRSIFERFRHFLGNFFEVENPQNTGVSAIVATMRKKRSGKWAKGRCIVATMPIYLGHGKRMTRADRNPNRNETMTTATKQSTTAGTRVCTVGRDGAKMAGKLAQVYTGKIYEATPRKDGVLTWRNVGKFGGSRSGSGKPSAKFVAEIKAAAQHEWRDVRHGQVCD